MDSCPDWTSRVVQNLGSNGSQKQPTERTATFRRHHDQITLLGTGKLHDLLGGIPFENDSVDWQTMKLCTEDGICSLSGLLAPGGEKVSQRPCRIGACPIA
jgi:hypothetical protein